MDRKEKIFLFIAHLLGADLFKRYWPPEGSYWNETHIDKNNPNDLRDIINQSKKNINIHVRSMLGEDILFTALLLFGSDLFKHNMIIMFILNIMHFYAIMIQFYNRILAQNQLTILKKDGKDEISDEMGYLNEKNIQDIRERRKKLERINQNNEIIISPQFGNYYQLESKEYRKPIGPPLKDLEKIINLRDFYYGKISDSQLEVMEFFHVYRESELYLEFLNL